MIAVIQRVSKADVSINQKKISRIKKGYLVLFAAIKGDTQQDLDYLVKKVSGLRIMADKDKKMNLNLKDANGEVLVISQFTLAGNVQKGNRPSFINSADPQTGEKYYLEFIQKLKNQGLTVKTGRFGSYMQVNLINDGPATIIINSKTKA